MSGHHEGEFDADYWEGRYRSGGGASRRSPSPSLLAEAADLAPGTALDAGCGWGADALWLAGRGWRVTAVDVSPAALEQAREASEAADQEAAAGITWTAADLVTWDPAERFDLVSSHFVHVPGPPEALFARLASWVAPGGTLLIVGHGYTPGEHHHDDDTAHGKVPAATAQVRISQMTADLRPEAWEVLVAEPRTHAIPMPSGGVPAVLQDVVVKARRRPASCDEEVARGRVGVGMG